MPGAIKPNCLALLSTALLESKYLICCQGTAANETELCSGMASLPSAVEGGIIDGGPHKNPTTFCKRKPLSSGCGEWFAVTTDRHSWMLEQCK